MKKGIFVCARSGSSRLSNKMNLDLGGKTALEYLIDRIKFSKYYDEIVLCTTNLQEDDCLVDIAKKTNVSYYRGSIEDKLDRWYMAALKFDIDYFVNVDGDDLFCESKLIDMAFKQYDEDDHDFIRCDESKLVAGIFTFGIKTKSLERIWNIKDTTDTEASWLYFYDLNFLNSVMLKDIPKVFYRPEIRATLDYEEDFIFFKTIVDYFYKNNIKEYNLEDIILFLDKNPDIIDINQFRHIEYLENQKKLNKLSLSEES